MLASFCITTSSGMVTFLECLCGGLHSQEAARLSEINDINSHSQLSSQASAHIKQSHRIERDITQHGEVNVAVRSSLTVGLASVEPEPMHGPLWECSGQLVQQTVGKLIECNRKSVAYQEATGDWSAHAALA